ncbi:MAG: zinc-ribbon domain-containing protein [Bacilli bacterium]|nr:zinc-ribbon domain-containing protein [Bacilli bacterium]
MKYCTKCGAPMGDDALFCPKCGTKVEEVVIEKPAPQPAEEKPTEQPKQEKPVANQESPKTNANAKIKGARVPIHEQPVKQFLPVPLALIGCSIALWIINAVGNTSGITRIMPLLIFMFLSGFLGVMSLVRAIKTIKRQIYFKAALSFVLFVLLVTCFIIDFVFLINS